MQRFFRGACGNSFFCGYSFFRGIRQCAADHPADDGHHPEPPQLAQGGGAAEQGTAEAARRIDGGIRDGHRHQTDGR